MDKYQPCRNFIYLSTRSPSQLSNSGPLLCPYSFVLSKKVKYLNFNLSLNAMRRTLTHFSFCCFIKTPQITSFRLLLYLIVVPFCSFSFFCVKRTNYRTSCCVGAIAYAAHRGRLLSFCIKSGSPPPDIVPALRLLEQFAGQWKRVCRIFNEKSGASRGIFMTSGILCMEGRNPVTAQRRF